MSTTLFSPAHLARLLDARLAELGVTGPTAERAFLPLFLHEFGIVPERNLDTLGPALLPYLDRFVIVAGSVLTSSEPAVPRDQVVRSLRALTTAARLLAHLLRPVPGHGIGLQDDGFGLEPVRRLEQRITEHRAGESVDLTHLIGDVADIHDLALLRLDPLGPVAGLPSRAA